MNVDFQKVDWFVVGISGGKDSTALLLYLLYEFFPKHNIPLYKLICIFTDTENEARETYMHIWRISRYLRRVKWLKTEGFYNLARRKKRFPSTKARFCTTELKIIPSQNFMNTLEGNILSVSGVRADESKARENLTEFAGTFESYHGYVTWRPLIKWTIEDIFLIHKKYNFPLNPLYSMGFERVGCLPCIMSRKKEIRLLAKLFPERIKMLSEAENTSTGKNGFSSFFPRNTIPLRYRSKEISTKKEGNVLVGTINDVVGWSQTSDHKQSSNLDFHFEDFENNLEERICQSGFCE